MDGLNDIISQVKRYLKSANRKYYTFLLGKFTDEKIANFSEHIDCFVLISCPQTALKYWRVLMKPIANPLDVKMAFDSDCEWSGSYAFDYASKITKKTNKLEDTLDDKKENLALAIEKSSSLAEFID